MYPQKAEIEEVGNAFITLGMPEYSESQQEFLANFLKRYAIDLDEDSLKQLFREKIEVVDAVQTLHSFASHYHAEEEVLNEFHEEIEDLLMLINGGYEGISF